MKNNESIKKSVFKDVNLAVEVSDKGFVRAGNIGKSLLARIRNIYKEHHTFLENPTGVFHTLYSTDLGYRSNLNQALEEVLKPTYDSLFTNYKITANLIIAKFSDQNSAFSVHQDTTGLDESVFTPLNVWIPMQDTDLDNGCLCLVPQSQKFAFPYRGTSFKGQFDEVTESVKPYLYPIKMKAGDLLIFDNRTLHYSPPNTLKNPRVVVMSGIFHQQAEILTCFQKNTQSPIEIYKQSDNYLLTYKGFKTEPAQADSGEKIKELFITPPVNSKTDFEALVNKYALTLHDAFSTPKKGEFYFKKPTIIWYIKDQITKYWS